MVPGTFGVEGTLLIQSVNMQRKSMFLKRIADNVKINVKFVD